MKLLIDTIPFSAYGSYLVISQDQESKKILIRDLHGGDEVPTRLYEVMVRGHDPSELNICCNESECCITSRKGAAGFIKAAFGREDTIYFLVEGLTMEWYAVGGKYDTLVPLSEDRYEHHCYEKQRKFMCSCFEGEIRQEQEFMIIGSKHARLIFNEETKVTRAVLEGYQAVRGSGRYKTYEQVSRYRQEEFRAFKGKFRNQSDSFKESFDLAVYLAWANFVKAEGMLTEDAMYMSKNSMNNIWSWDNCFGGIALSRPYPELAFGQMKIFMDTQHESGCYPDYVNDRFASFNCVKPPIHGWAYQIMTEQNPVFLKRGYLEPFYESLSRSTQYWLTYRVHEGSLYPVYYHGNDSGWDNASIFHEGMPVESPDLAAFLIYQMDVLETFAARLGKTDEAVYWQGKADSLAEGFCSRFYHEGRFYPIQAAKGVRITGGESLLMYLPLMIGYRLEQRIVEQLAADLEEKFEAPYGLMTEYKESGYYKKGGYWLGPVWAPPTYLMIDALRRNGYRAFAKRLAVKFCKLTKIGLMSENYDPFTGAGYDDPGFSWPACVLLQLLSEYNTLKE